MSMLPDNSKGVIHINTLLLFIVRTNLMLEYNIRTERLVSYLCILYAFST